jgi:transposase InsO family protein
MSEGAVPASTPSPDGHPPCPAFERKPGAPFPPEVREYALLLAVSGVKRREIARLIGATTEAVRTWVKKARKAGTMPEPPVAPSSPADPVPPVPSMPQRAPRDPGSGLSPQEEAEILAVKKRSPSMGPAWIRTQLKRFQGWRLSVRAIARVLEAHGYLLVHTASRPKGDEDPDRFEAPHRNAIWQLDFVELRVGPERRALLLVEDDFSRFCVAHALFEHPTGEDVVSVLTAAIRLHGKPESVYTDRGGPFLDFDRETSFGAFLERELIDHHLSASYRPQGRGKVESLAGTVRRELWDVCHFGSVDEAQRALDDFLRGYNHARAHMGIDGLTPADRFFGRQAEVLANMEAVSRRRQGLALFSRSPGDPFVTEELLPGGPCEILRLALHGGHLFLSFLGHRVDLGKVES